MTKTIRSVISERVAANSLVVILSLVTMFHLFVLLRIIPFEIVWGGRLQNTDQMIVFESVSLLLNVIMIAVVVLHTGHFKMRVGQRITTVALWLMVMLFLINTVGNLLSTNQTEKIVFTPLTAILCIFCFRLAIGRKDTVPTVESES
jgi:hypothetical protein